MHQQLSMNMLMDLATATVNDVDIGTGSKLDSRKLDEFRYNVSDLAQGAKTRKHNPGPTGPLSEDWRLAQNLTQHGIASKSRTTR